MTIVIAGGLVVGQQLNTASVRVISEASDAGDEDSGSGVRTTAARMTHNDQPYPRLRVQIRLPVRSTLRSPQALSK